MRSSSVQDVGSNPEAVRIRTACPVTLHSPANAHRCEPEDRRRTIGWKARPMLSRQYSDIAENTRGGRHDRPGGRRDRIRVPARIEDDIVGYLHRSRRRDGNAAVPGPMHRTPFHVTCWVDVTGEGDWVPWTH